MGCQKCWPTLSQEEIERRQLPCRQQCWEERGCSKCAEENPRFCGRGEDHDWDLDRVPGACTKCGTSYVNEDAYWDPKTGQWLSKQGREGPTLQNLREKILSIYGKASAFNLLGEDFEHVPDVVAAKETGKQIVQEAVDALKILNYLRKESK